MIPWLSQLTEHPSGQRLGWALVHSLWQGAAIALAMAVALRLLRKGSPQVRWLFSSAAFAVLAVSPFLTACLVDTDSAAIAERSVVASPRATALEMEVDNRGLAHVGKPTTRILD